VEAEDQRAKPTTTVLRNEKEKEGLQQQGVRESPGITREESQARKSLKGAQRRDYDEPRTARGPHDHKGKLDRVKKCSIKEKQRKRDFGGTWDGPGKSNREH